MSASKMLYVVGQLRAPTWEMQGVFDDRALAEAACLTDQYFVGPVELNQAFPDETLPAWPGAYYPKGGATNPTVMVPQMCDKHQLLLLRQARYAPSDPWQALIVMANVALFQGATCDPKVHEEIGGTIERIGELGCLACRKPELFGEVVEAAKKKHDKGALKALGERWIAESQQKRAAEG